MGGVGGQVDGDLLVGALEGALGAEVVLDVAGALDVRGSWVPSNSRKI
jgi:hypothetical protein